MALLDELIGVDAAALTWVSSVENALTERPDAYGGYFDHYAYDQGVDPELVIRSAGTPPLGVHSVGLIAADDGWRPGMLVMRDLAPDSQVDSSVPQRTSQRCAISYSPLGTSSRVLFASSASTLQAISTRQYTVICGAPWDFQSSSATGR
jgi:hypothetical protein